MFFSHVLFTHVHAAVTLATAVIPSLSNPLALAVALGGIAMAVAMLLAALSFKRPTNGSSGPAHAQAIAEALSEPPIATRSAVTSASRRVKAVV